MHQKKLSHCCTLHCRAAETTKLPLQFPNAEYDQASVAGCCLTGCWGSLCCSGCCSAMLRLLEYWLSPPGVHMRCQCCRSEVVECSIPGALLHYHCLQVFMISYMVDRQGYLIINREVGGWGGHQGGGYRSACKARSLRWLSGACAGAARGAKVAQRASLLIARAGCERGHPRL